MDSIPDHETACDSPNLVETSSPFLASESKLFVVPIETYDTSMCGPLFSIAEAKVVPRIASHWGVVLEIPQPKGMSYGILYHLTFIEWRDRSTREIHRKVALHSQSADTVFGTEVGTTLYSMSDVYNIGKNLVKEFGSYHHVFWNCRLFMNSFLQILTKSDNDFYRHIPTEKSKLFIPAFDLSADNKPCKSKKNVIPFELKALVEKGDIGTLDGSKSDDLISHLYDEAQADPKWIAIKKRGGWHCCIV
jgi:hypothetical protein